MLSVVSVCWGEGWCLIIYTIRLSGQSDLGNSSSSPELGSLFRFDFILYTGIIQLILTRFCLYL